MVSDSTLKMTFKKFPLVEFWYGVKEEYLQFSENAIQILVPFPTVYQCKATFSSQTSTKRCIL